MRLRGFTSPSDWRAFSVGYEGERERGGYRNKKRIDNLVIRLYIKCMNITEHALDRMFERGFTPEMLGKFLASGYRVLAANDGRYKMVGVVDGVSWTLIVESDMYTVVTVRRSHGGEA